LITCDDQATCSSHENIHDRGSWCCWCSLLEEFHVRMSRLFAENVAAWKTQFPLSLITFRPSLMPNADGLLESPRWGRLGKIIVEQPGGNVAITEGQHRDDYTLYSAMYQRITCHAYLFVEHANINPIIGCLSYSTSSQFPISALCNSSETLKRKRGNPFFQFVRNITTSFEMLIFWKIRYKRNNITFIVQ